MDKDEIKPSFSLKYLVLTLVTTLMTAFIISLVSWVVNNFQDAKPANTLDLINGFELNLLDDGVLPKEVVEAKYFLKGDPQKEISTFFRKRVSIRNSGTEGVENLNISAVIKGDSLFFAADPKINTLPKEIIDAIEVTKGINSDDTKHDWVVSLLNPGEIISFEYSVYSEEVAGKVELNIIPRKKDWTVVEQSLVVGQERSTPPFAPEIGSMVIFLLIFMLVLTVIIYRIQWEKRRDLRERYSSFSEFYWKHNPIKLFDSINKSVN